MQTTKHFRSIFIGKLWPLPLMVAALLLAISWAPSSARAENGFVAGQFLVATPKMPDPRFSETVIFICRHDRNGALGLVLNRPAGQIPLQDLMQSQNMTPGNDQKEVAVGLGGPVQLQLGFVLHSSEFSSGEPICRAGGLAISNGRDVLAAMSRDEGPERSIIFFGYSGWAPGQLEGEMADNGWVTIPADSEMLFDKDIATLWRRALIRRGQDL